MPTPQIPVRTPLGQDELRQRRGELGQRHRTILFMVDGRRELAEVLSLAHQAGASTSHFEDLVRHGLVELPQPFQPSTPAMPPELSEAAIETFEAEPNGHLARVAVVELPVARHVPAEPAVSRPVPLADPEPEPELPIEPVLEAAPPAAAAVVAALAERVERAERREPVLLPEPPTLALPADPPVRPLARPAEPVPVPAAPKRQRFRISRGLRPAPPPDAAVRFVPPIAAPNLVEDESVLEEVRGLLLEALRLDPPSYASRLPNRVRQARDTQQLIDLIWEMERDAAHPRRSARGKARIHDAREALGMGNTQVAEDSRPDITEF